MKRLHHLLFSAAPAAHALFLCFSMLLAGCASAPPAPQIVKVPVYLKCVDEKTLPRAPVFEFSALTPAATQGDKVLALTRDWPRARAYEEELQVIIEGCR